MSSINLVKGFLSLMIGSASPEVLEDHQDSSLQVCNAQFCDHNMLSDYRSHMLKFERCYECPGSAPFKDQKQIPEYCPNRDMMLAALTTI